MISAMSKQHNGSLRFTTLPHGPDRA
jgi:hypothetical protein